MAENQELIGSDTDNDFVFGPQLGQFLALGAGQAPVIPAPGVAFRLLDPFAYRSLGQVEVPRDLTH